MPTTPLRVVRRGTEPAVSPDRYRIMWETTALATGEIEWSVQAQVLGGPGGLDAVDGTYRIRNLTSGESVAAGPISGLWSPLVTVPVDVVPGDVVVFEAKPDTAGQFYVEFASAIIRTVAVADTEAPVVQGGQSFSPAEGSANGTVVGTIVATDNIAVTAMQIVTGNTSSAFALANDGTLTVANSAALTGGATWTLNVRASDAAGNNSTDVGVSVSVPGSAIHEFKPQEPLPTVTPAVGSTTRVVNSLADWNAAAAAAVPGDVVDVQSSFTGPCVWSNRSGSELKPIIIYSSNGSTITVGAGTNRACIDVDSSDFVDVIGLTTVGGDYGIRYRGVQGTATRPCRIRNNTCSNSRYAKIPVQNLDSSGRVSAYIHVTDNECFGNDGNVNDRKVSEGVYVGSGTSTWTDDTHHVEVRRNLLHDFNTEAIEAKHGASDVIISHNYIHTIDLEGTSDGTGAISCWVTPSGTVPSSYSDANISVYANRIRNVTTYGHGAITFGFGGIDVDANLIWDYDTWGIRFQTFGGATGSGQAVTPNQVRNNTMHGDGFNQAGSGVAPSITTSHNIYNGTGTGQYTYAGADFVGPTTGTAVETTNYSAGFDGDGSGFLLDAASGANNQASSGWKLMVETTGTPDHLGAMPEDN